MQSDSIIKDSVYAFKKGYLNDIDKENRTREWDEVETSLAEASNGDDPTRVLYAYSCAQWFPELLNRDMAKNTYHQLNLYCTPLNCNVLARTQDGIQSVLSILFHPKLHKHFVRESLTVYRGYPLNDETLLQGYEENAIIITTTLLSTSKSETVPRFFADLPANSPNDDKISVFCTYKLHNRSKTALDMRGLSKFPQEEEILILPYVPFQILSFRVVGIDENLIKKFEVELEEIDDNREIDISTENQGLLSKAGTFSPKYFTISQ